MKCQYIGECPSASGWCNGKSEDEKCISFILTAYENLQVKNKHLIKKFKKAMNLLEIAVNEFKELEELEEQNGI